MKIEIQESTPTKKKSQFPAIFLGSVAAILVVLNVFATIESWNANRDLSDVEAFRDLSDRIKQQETDLASLLLSPRRQETRQAIADAFAESKPDSVIAIPSLPMWANSYYLYAPDDSVTLKLQLDVWKTKGAVRFAPFGTTKTGTGTEQSSVLEVPLQAGKLHLFSFGMDENRFRVRFDKQEVTSVLMPDSLESQGRSGSRGGGWLGKPNAITNLHFDFDKASKSNQWQSIDNISISRPIKSQKSGNGSSKNQASEELEVGFVASLTSSADKTIAPTMYLHAKRDLKLKWDPNTEHYQIVGPASSK